MLEINAPFVVNGSNLRRKYDEVSYNVMENVGSAIAIILFSAKFFKMLERYLDSVKRK